MIKLIFTLIALIIFNPFSEAKLEDYFKKANFKSEVHRIKNIDFIYMINLDERPEKFERSMNQFAPYKIYPYRFSAVNGWKLPIEAFSELGITQEPWMTTGRWGTCYFPEANGVPHHEIVSINGRNYFAHCMTRGAIGIVLSHLSILQDAFDSGYKTIWVMEDDVEIIRDPHLLSELITQLDERMGEEGWDVLFTDRDTKDTQGNYVPCAGFAWRPNFTPADPSRFSQQWLINSELRQIGARFGAYSMILRRSGMEKLLNFFKKYQIFLPYDIDYTLPQDIRLFTVQQDVVSTQPKAFSDNGTPSYKESLKVEALSPSQNSEHIESLKQHIYQGLPLLEGWCSQEKASNFMDLILECKPDTWVEIGVFGGSSIFPVASMLKFLGKGKVIAIDPWDRGECIKHLDSPDDLANLDWWSKVDLNYIYNSYLNMLQKYELSDYCITMRTTSEKAAGEIGVIDVLYIDGNHSEEASTQDVLLYFSKVRSGGYIWMDDCLWKGTQNAVNLLLQSCDVIKVIDGGNCTLFKKK